MDWAVDDVYLDPHKPIETRIEMDNENRLLTLEQVVARTTLSKFTIYQMIKRGLFPKQIRVGRNRVAWLDDEIREWIEQKMSDRHSH